MTEQNDEQDVISQDYPSRMERRMERRAARRSRGGDTALGGLILIALGVLFLLQNMGKLTLINWWALFILLPALGAFTSAWRSFQDSGRLNRSVRASLVGGVILTLVAGVFLLELDWRFYGPVLIILAGVGFMLTALFPD